MKIGEMILIIVVIILIIIAGGFVHNIINDEFPYGETNIKNEEGRTIVLYANDFCRIDELNNEESYMMIYCGASNIDLEPEGPLKKQRNIAYGL